MRAFAAGPHYSLVSVLQFRDLFNKVDDNLNGTLSKEEWIEFLENIGHGVPLVLSKKLFLTLDYNNDGQRGPCSSDRQLCSHATLADVLTSRPCALVKRQGR